MKSQHASEAALVWNDPDCVHRGWLVIEILLIAALIIVFNFFTERIAISLPTKDARISVPLLAADFQLYLPLLNLWWGLAVILKVVQFAYNRWLIATRWADIALSLLTLVILSWLVFNGRIIGIEAQVANQPALKSLTPYGQRLVAIVTILIKLLLAGGLAGTLIGLGRKLHGMFNIQSWKGILLAVGIVALFYASFVSWLQLIVLGMAFGVLIGIALRDAIEQRNEDGNACP